MSDGFSSYVDRYSLDGTAKEIAERILPSMPPYYRTVREQYPSASSFDIERSILLNWDRSYGEVGKYGEPWHRHLARFAKLLIPSTVIHPWFMDECLALEMLLTEQRDILNLIGAKSSGKSAGCARISLTLLAIDPDNTIVYAAAPYKNVADYTIWGELESCFLEIKALHRDVYPGMSINKSANRCYFAQDKPRSARAELVGLDQAARLQGAKSVDPDKGFLVVIADEIGVFPSHAFIEILANITANKNLVVFTGCNFKNINGLEGPLCNPEGREYSNLSVDDDIFWRSDYNSLTLRFDGHRGPNIIADREIYPFLLLPRKMKDMEKIHGLKGPKYLEQVRSFPNMSTGDNFVLTREQLNAGGVYDKFWRFEGMPERVAFCDPGWKGDPCKIGAFEFGDASIQTHDGSMQRTMIIAPMGPIETIRVQAGMFADEEFLRKIRKHASRPIMLRPGGTVSMDMQIAVGCAEFLERHSIPTNHFGFDASCRGSITQEILSMVGMDAMVYDFGANPTKFIVDANGMTAEEKYRNLRTEMFFTLQMIVLASQLRNGSKIVDALIQICRHRYDKKGKKTFVESKDEYKKCYQGKSPDSGDVLVGAVHAARRLGFQVNFTRQSQERSFGGSLLSGAQQPLMRSRPRVARLASVNH